MIISTLTLVCDGCRTSFCLQQEGGLVRILEALREGQARGWVRCLMERQHEQGKCSLTDLCPECVTRHEGTNLLTPI